MYSPLDLTICIYSGFIAYGVHMGKVKCIFYNIVEQTRYRRQKWGSDKVKTPTSAK